MNCIYPGRHVERALYRLGEEEFGKDVSTRVALFGPKGSGEDIYVLSAISSSLFQAHNITGVEFSCNSLGDNFQGWGLHGRAAQPHMGHGSDRRSTASWTEGDEDESPLVFPRLRYLRLKGRHIQWPTSIFVCSYPSLVTLDVDMVFTAAAALLPVFLDMDGGVCLEAMRTLLTVVRAHRTAPHRVRRRRRVLRPKELMGLCRHLLSVLKPDEDQCMNLYRQMYQGIYHRDPDPKELDDDPDGEQPSTEEDEEGEEGEEDDGEDDEEDDGNAEKETGVKQRPDPSWADLLGSDVFDTSWGGPREGGPFGLGRLMDRSGGLLRSALSSFWSARTRGLTVGVCPVALEDLFAFMRSPTRGPDRAVTEKGDDKRARPELEGPPAQTERRYPRLSRLLLQDALHTEGLLACMLASRLASHQLIEVHINQNTLYKEVRADPHHHPAPPTPDGPCILVGNAGCLQMADAWAEPLARQLEAAHQAVHPGLRTSEACGEGCPTLHQLTMEGHLCGRVGWASLGAAFARAQCDLSGSRAEKRIHGPGDRYNEARE
ncbi:hypothetical protein PAPYR_2010 [Paratrimastix pyriformis]|uniref:Uncharacterized protein n=1 Tax=Paratrimastix pyriformis TaxID=342808 RepID=A0ABQ8UQL5_9EUKA|nr:hypothetical protein PAPYR_2010 [Paratrimastix pyriformis]